ncbi:integrase core domain-containing protein [Paracoccus hibiscisoli]|uniref:integrase core domain-containing protein n=1 Tax=Paracoccus hibiscisoli TaxID=2023261 RepID=UPI001B7FDCBD|nr:integrase core domain-containing protein [Paracoccus hibiscisoli]
MTTGLRSRLDEKPVAGHVHRHRFESIQHASRVIGDWISFYNNRRPHQSGACHAHAD